MWDECHISLSTILEHLHLEVIDEESNFDEYKFCIRKKKTNMDEQLVRDLAIQEEVDAILNYEAVEGTELENKRQGLKEQRERIAKMSVQEILGYYGERITSVLCVGGC